MSNKFNQPQIISSVVLLEKYARNAETSAHEIHKRVAIAIASAESMEKRQEIENQFFEAMSDGIVGGGRIMASAGTDIEATLANCFVIPVGDSIKGIDPKSGFPGIYDALTMAAETMRRGGGVGYDFSIIRPKNAYVKKTHSFASGPCSYMDVFDKSCETVEAAGARRGAQMGILAVDHPDLEDFITAKRTPGRWKNFNVSVFVSDAFMHAKTNNLPWQLVHFAEPTKELKDNGAFKREDGLWVYKTVSAKDIWDKIMLSNYNFAEPGVLFKDTINNDNNLRYAELIAATNPCAEQPLPPHGCCDLGQLILTLFVDNPFTEEASFNWDKLSARLETLVRMLDNVLDVTYWPLEEQGIEAANKRRIGAGFTGLGNALAMLNLVYGSPEALAFVKKLGETMRNVAYSASADLAKEKGAFPLFDADKYLEEGTFASRLPKKIKDKIRKYGIRNSHLLSIAPTGTVSLAFADNCSNGIEPPFSFVYDRVKRNQDGSKTTYQVIDKGLKVYLSTIEEDKADAILAAMKNYETSFVYKDKTILIKDQLPASLVTALELSTDAHIATPAAIKEYIDSAISKTINVPADTCFDDFSSIYDRAYASGLKGISTYRPNSILGSVLSVGKQEEKYDPKQDNFFNESIERRPSVALEAINIPVEYYGQNGKDKLYVSVSFISKEIEFSNTKAKLYRPVEMFVTGLSDSVPEEWVATFARSLSLISRSGLNTFCKALVENRKIKSHNGAVRYGFYEKADGTKVPRFHESIIACISYVVQNVLREKGIINEEGQPLTIEKILNVPTKVVDTVKATLIEEPVEKPKSIIPGKQCTECGAHAVIKKDGCDYCTNCSAIGSCG